jgi:exonuclease III
MANFRPSRSIIAEYPKINIATWNIQGGIRNPHSRLTLDQDMKKYKIDLACLQETHISTPEIQKLENGYLITTECPPEYTGHKRYGLAFFLSNQIMKYYYGYQVISNRIAVLILKINGCQNRTQYLKIINVYAPTAILTEQMPIETEKFYQDLNQTIAKHRSKTNILITAGDYNAKIGQRQDDEQFMGKYSKGTRNNNGHILATHLSCTDLYITNTHFRHSLKHITTWHGHIPKRKNMASDKIIRNQIDYIMIPKRIAGIVTQARSHHGHTFSSDHGIVKTSIDLARIYKITSHSHRKGKKKTHEKGKPKSRAKHQDKQPNTQVAAYIIRHNKEARKEYHTFMTMLLRRAFSRVSTISRL